MIIKFHKYNESEVNIQLYDRVVCHGTIKQWNDEDEYVINIEGQTGIVVDVRLGVRDQYPVIFDNYFFPTLIDLNRNYEFKRGLFIPNNQLERISYPVKNPMTFSKKAELLFNKLEFVKHIGSELDYIDITDKNDTISYLSKARKDRVPDKEIWRSPLRQEMKVGRFINTINPYTNPKSLDKKIDLYKAAHNGIIGKKSTFKIVNGEEIRNWYYEGNYQEGCGSLNKSCMRDKMERLNLYVNNPEKVSLLILVSDDNKLLGRSLIWNVDKPKLIYQDRIYTVYQEDVNRFEDYAKMEGWKYYISDSYDSMVVKLGYNTGRPDYNPYMDTFEFFYVNGKHGYNYLSNVIETYHEDTRYYEYTYV